MGVSGVISECFKGVKGKGVFPGCCMGVACELHGCFKGVSRLSQWCYMGTLKVLHKRVLHGCCTGTAWVFQDCHIGVAWEF